MDDKCHTTNDERRKGKHHHTIRYKALSKQIDTYCRKTTVSDLINAYERRAQKEYFGKKKGTVKYRKLLKEI